MRRGDSAVILAGGRSRRMGRPKALLEVHGASILERLLDEFGQVFDLAVIAAPRESETFDIERLLVARGPVTLLRDDDAFRGPAPALIKALRAARHSRVFVCSCDLPFIKVAVAQALLERLAGFDAVIPIVGGSPQPLCAAYRAECAGLMAAAVPGEVRIVRLINHLRVRRLEEDVLRQFDPGLRSFIDIDTPEDYQRALLPDDRQTL